MDLEKTLAENFATPSVSDILAPALKAVGAKKSNSHEKTLERLAAVGALARVEADYGKVPELRFAMARGHELRASERRYLTEAYTGLVESIERVDPSWQVLVIPRELKILKEEYDSAMRQLKHGPNIKLRSGLPTEGEGDDAKQVELSMKKADELKITPASLFQEAFATVKPYAANMGYVFAGIRNKEYRLVLFGEIEDALMIYGYCESPDRSQKSAQIRIMQVDERERADLRTAYKTTSRDPQRGGLFAGKVPSRSRVLENGDPFMHKVRIDNFPIWDRYNMPGRRTPYHTWIDFLSSDTCELSFELFNTQARANKVNLICAHALALEKAVVKYLRESGEPYTVPFLIDPIPAQSQWFYGMKLRNNVIQQNQTGEKETYSALRNIDREPLLSARVAVRGFEETFGGNRANWRNYVLRALS